MKTIIKQFSRDIDYEYNFNSQKVCFIDIETTGLSRQYNSIYLIGMLYFDNLINRWILIQLFADKIEEEENILLEFTKLISNYDKIITFNGETFDVPFINERMNIYNIQHNIQNELSLDIYREVKANRYFLNIDNLKLKTLERYLRLYRNDIYTGKDCIGFYLDYLKIGDKTLLERILQHNYDDLYYMIDVLKILDVIKEKKSSIIKYNGNELNLLIDKLSILGNHLIINGYVEDAINIKLIHYDNNFRIHFDKENNFEVRIEFSIGMVSPTEKGFYIDTKKNVLPNIAISRTKYNIPANILLLKVEKQYYIENIKNLLKEIIRYALIQNQL